MENKYKEIVKKNTPKEHISRNLIVSFLVGGIFGLLGQLSTTLFNKLGLTLSDSYMMTMILIVVLGSLFTGLGFFDKWVSYFKCGLIVPTSGFAHAMTSSAMDGKSEGFVKGIGANIFKLTGSIIAYGILFSFIFALIKVIFI